MNRPNQTNPHLARTTNLLGCVLLVGGLFLAGAGCRQQQNVVIPDQLPELQAKVKRDAKERIVEVDLRGTTVTNNDLEQLKALPAVRSILLSDTEVTDEGLELLSSVATLRNLDLRGCNISNQGIAKLAPLKELRALRLSGKSGKTVDVDDDAMAAIGKMVKLKVLAIDHLNFMGSPEGWAALAGLTELEELYAGNTLVDDEAIEVIVNQFPKLKKLRVSGCQVSDQGLVFLPKLTQLQVLDLSESSQVFDAGMAHIGTIKSLQDLNLWRVQVTDMGIEKLAGLTNMQRLNLDNVNYLSDEGLPHLKGMQQLKFLHVGSTAITDEGLVHLEPLKTLEDLRVTRTSVTEEGVAKLKQTLTNTKIQLNYLGDG